MDSNISWTSLGETIQLQMHFQNTKTLFDFSPWLSNPPRTSFIGNPGTQMIYGKLGQSGPRFVGSDFLLLKYQW